MSRQLELCRVAKGGARPRWWVVYFYEPVVAGRGQRLVRKCLFVSEGQALREKLDWTRGGDKRQARMAEIPVPKGGV